MIGLLEGAQGGHLFNLYLAPGPLKATLSSLDGGRFV